MTEHRSHPDQLMARALGWCWHSPTSDRWPCGPLCASCDHVRAEHRDGVCGAQCGCQEYDDPVLYPCGDVHGSGDVCNRPTGHSGWHHVDGSGGLGWTS